MENQNSKSWYKVLRIIYIVIFLYDLGGAFLNHWNNFSEKSDYLVVAVATLADFLFLGLIYWGVSRLFFVIFFKEKFISGEVVDLIKKIFKKKEMNGKHGENIKFARKENLETKKEKVSEAEKVKQPSKRIFSKIPHILFIIFTIVVLIPITGGILAPLFMGALGGGFGILIQIGAMAMMCWGAYAGYRALIKHNKENNL